MIITLVCSAVLAFLGLVLPTLAVILPAEFVGVLGKFFGVVAMGFSFIANFIHVDYILALLALIVAWDAAEHTWGFILWVLKKIPFLHIS